MYDSVADRDESRSMLKRRPSTTAQVPGILLCMHVCTMHCYFSMMLAKGSLESLFECECMSILLQIPG